MADAGEEGGGAARDPLLGALVAGRYRVEELIGKGGMGAVYRAVQEPMGREVAIKVLKAELVADRSVAKRFLVEAQAASALGNPHTVTIHDFGQTEAGLLFIAMERLEGPSLAERLAVGPLPWDQAAEVGAQVCRALAEAHRKGIVHRDLKPENVMLTTSDEGSLLVKVVDFGIAKVVGQGEGGLSTPGVTAEGTIVGTPRYMSPEQAQGGEPGAASDLYALGVILHEAIAGAPPFDHDKAVVLMALHIESAPPPLSSPLGPVPRPMVDLVESLLAKDPAARPHKASAVAVALRNLAGVESLRAELVLGEASGGDDPAQGCDTSDTTQKRPARAEEPSDTERMRSSELPTHPSDRAAPRGGHAAPSRRSPAFLAASLLVAGLAVAAAAGVLLYFVAPRWTSALRHGAGPTAVTAPGPGAGPASATRPRADGGPPSGRPDAEPTRDLAPIQLASSPAGARVSLGAEYLCTTPCGTRLPAGLAATLRFELRGFRTATVEVVPGRDAEASATLPAAELP